MPSPTPSLNLLRLYGKFDSPAATGPALMAGKWKVTLPVDLESIVDDSIVLSGVFDSGDLKTTGPYSIDVMVPCNDDPDITSLVAWRVIVDITFSDGRVRHYELDTPYANRLVADGGDGKGVNLRGKPSTGSPAVTQIPTVKFGEPGGVAVINSAGQVLDGFGNPVTIGGSVAPASTTTAGIVPFATSAKADAGTDTESAMTPALVKRRTDAATLAATDASQPRSVAAPVVAAAGSAKTLAGGFDTFSLTLSAASCAITLPPAPGVPSGIIVALRQDATGNRAVTWVAPAVTSPATSSVTWSGTGVPPVLNPAAGTTTYVTLVSLDGTANWVGASDAAAPAPTGTPTASVSHRATDPAAFTYTTCDRMNAKLTNSAVLTSGTLYHVAIELPAGALVKRIGFLASGSGVGMTNQWFEIRDANRNKLGVTLDDGAAAWSAGIMKMLTLPTAVTISASGLYYLGICVVGTTPPKLASNTSLAYVMDLGGPVVAANSTTGLTTPATSPAVATLGPSQADIPYGGVSAT